jgi:hypothetical protein
MNGDFKNWWTTTKFEGTPASMTLGIVYSGVMNKTNLVGKEVAKAEIAFVTYRRQHTGESAGVDKPAADVFYDVTKAEPIATATVSGSKIPLAVWHQEKLIDIKLAQPVPARDKSGKLIEIDKVYPSYMKSEGQSATDKPTTTDATTAATTAATSATTTNTATSANTSTSTAATTTYVGIKKAAGFSQPVQDLQKKIKALGGDSAAALGKAGADGKYGSGTANAIAKIVGSSTPVDDITADISAKLDAAFANLTQAQIDAANTKIAETPTVVKKPKKPKLNPGF